MRLPSPSLFAAVLVLVLAVPSRAQTVAPAEPTTKPAIVSILGASVSAGFTDPKPRADGEPNSTVKLAVALAPLWAAGAVRLGDRSDVATFLQPVRAQTRHVEKAIADAPAAVVAIDFMFWFGYGGVRGDERETRLALQREGLALLERFEVPVLVGDYPDMHGADPRMLSARQIPSVDILAALNENLRAWAAKRPNVRVFPLADFVAHAKGDGLPVRYRDTDLRLGPDVLMQGDGLHASRVGMALLAEQVGAALAAWLPADCVVRPRAAALSEFLDAVGSRFVLDELAKEAAEKGEPAHAGGGR